MGQQTGATSLENNFDPNCRKDMPDRYPPGDEDRYQEQAGADMNQPPMGYSREDYVQSSDPR